MWTKGNLRTMKNPNLQIKSLKDEPIRSLGDNKEIDEFVNGHSGIDMADANSTETPEVPMNPISYNFEGQDMLQNLRIKNLGRILIGSLNVNSLVSKFEELKIIVNG